MFVPLLIAYIVWQSKLVLNGWITIIIPTLLHPLFLTEDDAWCGTLCWLEDKASVYYNRARASIVQVENNKRTRRQRVGNRHRKEARMSNSRRDKVQSMSFVLWIPRKIRSTNAICTFTIDNEMTTMISCIWRGSDKLSTKFLYANTQKSRSSLRSP